MPAIKLNSVSKKAIILTSAREKGFSLIELLITLAMLSFIILALYNFYSVGLKGWTLGIDHLENQQSARISMNKMISELRYAHEVFILNDNSEEIYFRVNYKGKSTLFRFRLHGGQLIFEQLRDNYTHYAYNVVALGISGLNFFIDHSGNVLINISAGSKSKTISLTGSIYPRNVASPEPGGE